MSTATMNGNGKTAETAKEPVPATTKKAAEVKAADFDLRTTNITIEGTAPILFHQFAEKAKREMRDKQLGVGRAGKETRDPEADFLGSMYPLTGGGHLDLAWAKRVHTGTVYPVPDPEVYERPAGGFGFPSVGIKAAAIRAAKDQGYTMVDMRGRFHILGEYVQIAGDDSWECREDMVRLNGKSADLRWRGLFNTWSAVLPIQYNARAISIEELVTVLTAGGFSVGIGEWRPEKNGQFGTFRVV